MEFLVSTTTFLPYRHHNPLSVRHEIKNFQAYLIYLKNVNSLPEVFNYFWNVSYITNVNVIVPSNHCLRIFSYSPFSISGCRQISIKEHSISCGTNHSTFDYYPVKTLNMYKCPLRTASWTWLPYSKVVGNNVTFFEGMILNAFIKVVNASFKVTLMDGTDGADSKDVVSKKADLMHGEYKMTIPRNGNFTYGVPHYDTSVIMFLKRENIRKSSALILLKPFREWALTFLICTIFVTTIIGSCVSKMSLLNIFFNIISILLSNSYKVRDSKYQVRLFMSAWMVFGLILAASYHAIFFETLRSDLHYQLPVKYGEIVSTNYSKIFIMDIYLKNDIFYFPEIEKENFQFIFTNNNEPPVSAVQNSDRKLIGIATIVMFSYFSLRDFGDTTTLHQLSEAYFKFYYTIYFSRNSFLVNDYDKMIMQLKSAGLIEKWMADILKIKKTRSGAQKPSLVLSYAELGAIFNLSGYLFVVASLVLMLEIWWSRRSRRNNISFTF